MLFNQPQVIEIIQNPEFDGAIEQIDICAGICYGRKKPHDTPEQQRDFVKKLIQKNHMRPLEFGTIYLKIDSDQSRGISTSLFKSPYCMICDIFENGHWVHYITTNYRYIVEEKLEFVLQHWCEPTEHHYKRRTFLLHCSRVTGDSFRTHVSLSSIMKSTRWCNLSNLEITKPHWFIDATKEQKELYCKTLNYLETQYKALLDSGLPIQNVRGILPMDTATELILCGFDTVPNTGWMRFVQLRTDKSAHPDAQLLAHQIKNILYGNEKTEITDHENN